MTSLLRANIPRPSSSIRRFLVKNYATELPRQPPLPRSSPEETVAELYHETSRPRPYYAKHPPFRDLPKRQRAWPAVLAAVVLGGAGWFAFMSHVANQEMLSSSVYRSIIRSVREDPQVRMALGDAVRPQPEWWLNGDPKITGHISQLAGNIDVSFRIKGSKGSGTLYFTSIRKEKGVPFTVLRFKVICDDGTVILVENSPV